MALISIKRNVDLQPGLNAPAVFNCSQSDKGTTIMLGLMNGGNDYTVPSGVTITIRGSRSNGAVFTPVSATFSGSTASFTLTEEMTDTAGPTLCEAVLEQGNNVLGTANFIINVEGSPMGADVPPVFTDAAWDWMLGKFNSEIIPEFNASLIDAIDSKLDKVFPTDLSGKYLKINSTGHVEPSDIEEIPVDATLSHEGEAADAKATGDALALKANESTIAPEFDTSTSYTAGSYVYKNGVLYMFTSAHTGAWTGTDAETVTVGGEVTDLKADLSEKVDIAGENQVTPQNIQGMQFTKTPVGEVKGDNIFTSDMLFEEGYYAYINPKTGTVTHSYNSVYNSYCIPVNSNSKYNFTQARFAVLAKGNTLGSEAVGSLLNDASQVETGDASYLFLSITSSTDINSIEVHELEPSDEYIYTDFILPDWLVDNLPIPTVVEKPKFATATGNIASGGNLQLTAPRNNLRKGERIVFEGNISSFDSLRIGLSFSTAVGTDSNQVNTFRIDGTNISYYAISTSTPVTVTHGLTIVNNIQIIWEMSAEASVKFTLISNGNMFTHVFTPYVRKTISNPFVLSVGTVLTDCKLTWTCADIDKKIWMFGDSYFAYSQQRWTYYLHQYGYDQNCLLDGFSGEGGVNGRVAFNNLLQYGTPKFAVWCLGMNDATDSESAPSTAWVTHRNYFLNYCNQNNITPIFGTIPTVPSINHEQKNAWIRSSGYRYIDFAKAVGASSSGVWFNGMLFSDNVHPTEQGARALFARVLLDLPEIMLDGAN